MHLNLSVMPRHLWSYNHKLQIRLLLIIISIIIIIIIMNCVQKHSNQV